MFGRAILGVLCAIGSAEASAAALLEETLRNGHVVLHLTGQIDSRDAALFDARVAERPGLAIDGGNRQQQVSTIQRNRPTEWRGAASIQTRLRRRALKRGYQQRSPSQASKPRQRAILAETDLVG
jgi:hypothetical protein